MSAADAGDGASPPTSEHEQFVHNLAIKISRATNSLNPSDTLAGRVIDFAKNNAQNVPGFMAGLFQLSFELLISI